MEQFFLESLRCPRHPDDGSLTARAATGRDDCLSAVDGRLTCTACGTGYPVANGIVDMLRDFSASDSPSFLDAESRQWDREAPHYDQLRAADVIYMNCIRAGLRALDAKPGDVILDAGCGTGLGTRLLHHSGISTVALDLSMASLEQLRRRVTATGINYVRADISSLPFAADTFDKLICANTLQHVPTPQLRQRCVEEFARVVRPGGTVVVTVHGFSIPKRRAGWSKEGTAALGYGANETVQYIYRHEAQELRDLLAQRLRVKSITGAGLPLPYRLKLSPLSLLVERWLSRFQWSAPWGHILVGNCSVE